MNQDQTSLYDKAGELARQFHDSRNRLQMQPGPDRPWFFHPLGYYIDLGYSGEVPEYDRPEGHFELHTTNFAKRIGVLGRIAKVWEDKKALDIARECLPPHLEFESRQLTEEDMKDVVIPTKPERKDGIMKELEWREQWRIYGEQFTGIQNDYKIRILLKWFKEDFFQWVNNPHCPVCKSNETRNVGITLPTKEESRYEVGSVELWKCTKCGRDERFPRYNDPVKLLATRKGRCGEFANCFAFLVRATGVRTRWVWNSEDHVWVEYYSTRQKRWIHLDACENAYDDPLLYARNWRKKMAYCIAFDEFGAMDVTRRYVRRPQEEGIPRVLVREEHIPLILQVFRNFRRSKLTMLEVIALEKLDNEEEMELHKFIEDENKPSETSEHAASVQPEIGRQTGTADWKKARGEDGARH